MFQSFGGRKEGRRGGGKSADVAATFGLAELETVFIVTSPGTIIISVTLLRAPGSNCRVMTITAAMASR